MKRSLLFSILVPILVQLSHGEESTLNRLADSASPYLRQHAKNPVDWYPWGEEAFAAAKKQNKPIFLSIGYSTCHWCHVMERESFENPEIAKRLNEHFIAIKVDREQRPDVDQIYQTFVQATTGQGGWPTSVFLTPERLPFFGGLYFPPKSEFGRPGFDSVLTKINTAWQTDEANLRASAKKGIEQIQSFIEPEPSEQALTQKEVDATRSAILAQVDKINGGLGNGAKFPSPSVLEFLIADATRYPKTSLRRQENVEVVRAALDALVQGALQDHLAGGFHRYTVDPEWKLPHFEKMLYDQAQLANLYLDAFQLTGEARYAETARRTLDYVSAQLRSGSGGFHSAEDADSLPSSAAMEKREGAFYTWTEKELLNVLGEEGYDRFKELVPTGADAALPEGFDPHGELAGQWVLRLKEGANPLPEDLIEPLLEYRRKRPRPAMDDKVITAWNGLMIEAFARASVVLNSPKDLEVAKEAASFIKNELYSSEDGKLRRSWSQGKAGPPAVAMDYAGLIHGIIALHQAEQDPSWLSWAITLQERQVRDFHDANNGGFFDADRERADLVLQMKMADDNALPSVNSLSTRNLQAIAALSHRDDFHLIAKQTLKTFAVPMRSHPASMTQMSIALIGELGATRSLVLVEAANSPKLLSKFAQSQLLPFTWRIELSDENQAAYGAMSPLLKSLADSEKGSAFVCTGTQCGPPISDPETLKTALSPK